MSAPFEYHPAHPIEIENRARQLLRLADETTDHQATTHQAHQPATTAWDGIAATELQAAPEPVRKQAEQVASQLSWAALPLRYWADQIRRFNNQVDTLLLRLAQIPTEVEHQLRLRYTDLSPEFEDPLRDYERDRIRHELINDLRRQWEHAYDTHIHDGARTAAGMLAQGPTYEYLQLARERALMPTGALVDYLAVGWDRTAAVQEAHRIATALLDPTATLPTNEEIDRLANLLDQYEGDEQFAYLLLTGLGPQGLLELTAQVATLTIVGADPGAGVPAETIGAIQAGLAAALATATRRRNDGSDHLYAPYQPGEFELPPQWIEELIVAGGQRFLVGVNSAPRPELYGYQALGVLLSHGGYDSDFLALAGGALIDFERSQGGSEVWWGVQPIGFRLNWIDGDAPSEPPAGYDPMIGLLKALSSDLEATKQLFTALVVDGDDGSYLPRLDYLLTDREWPVDEVTDPSRLPTGQVSPGIALFGELLERAATVDVDERSYRLVEEIIKAIATDESAKGFPNDPSGAGAEPTGKTNIFGAVDVVHEDFRPYLGRIAAHYIEDIHWRSEGNMGAPDKLTAGRMRLPGVDERHLIYFLAEIGKDPRAHSEVVAAELVYADRLYRAYLDGWDGTDSDAMEIANRRVTNPLSIVLGATDFGRSEAIRHGYAAADEAHNQAVAARLFWVRLAGSALPGNVPGGQTVNFLGGTVLDYLEEKWRHDSTGVANYYVGDLRHSGAMMVEDMIDVIVYEQLTNQLTPEEFLSHVSERGLADAEKLIYGPDHPQAGSFVPPEEWQQVHWDAWEEYKGSMDETFVDAPQEDAVAQYRKGFNYARDITGH